MYHLKQYVKKLEKLERERLVRQQTKALTSLFLGCLSGLMGCVFVVILGLMKFNNPLQKNFKGELFPSGHNYFPGTVSEMVHDLLETTTGKCFFAFGNLSSICLLLSWYPWHLANVHVWRGPDENACGCWDSCRCCKVKIILLMRHISLPIFLFLVVNIPVVPQAQRGRRDDISEILHSGSSMLMLVLYYIPEVATLCHYRCDKWVRNPRDPDEAEPHFWEWLARCLTIAVSVVASVIFLVCGRVIGGAYGSLKECNDKWEEPNITGISFAQNYTYIVELLQNIESPHAARNMLLDTASHPLLAFKWAQFASECVAVILVLCNLLVIACSVGCLKRHDLQEWPVWPDPQNESSDGEDSDDFEKEL